MANEQGLPMGREWQVEPGEIADNLGTPSGNVRDVITGDRQVVPEPIDDAGMVTRDDDGYVGPDGKMQPHQSPTEVTLRNDPELNAERLDAAGREEIEEFRGIWE